MSLHYAPDFFKTITAQKRDDLREEQWPEAQVQQREQELRDTKLLELYTVISQKAIDMWITRGKIPARHGYYNFHKEAHYAITDYMNLYLYNMPDDYKKSSYQFTQQDYYFVVVHTTEGLLREMTADIAIATQRDDMTGWCARKEIDTQYQIKAGEVLGRLSGWKKTINVGKYMELKVAHRNTDRSIIEEKIEYKQNHFHDYSIITTNMNLDDNYAVKMTIELFQQAKTKPDENNPPHHHRFFLFLVQHYLHRLQNIFQRAGATQDHLPG
eukprot:1170962-Amphidinium_carterae.2